MDRYDTFEEDQRHTLDAGCVAGLGISTLAARSGRPPEHRIRTTSPQKSEDNPVGNRLRPRVAKIPGLVAKFRRHFLLCSAPLTRTFPSAATGKPDAAREGRRFWKRNPAPPEPDRGFGFETGSEVPRDGGSGPTAERREGTSAPLRRDGGPIGTSAGNGWGFDPRGLGTEASAEGPGCRSSSGDVRRRNGRKARPEPRLLRRPWRARRSRGRRAA
jgi:hypothetical protein